MNKAEACKILELEPSATKEEAKKQFKKLTLKYHPDVNKDPDANEKFKLINKAYSTFNSPAVRKSRETISIESIEVDIEISFKESILGKKHPITYKKYVACNICHGNSIVQQNNGCTHCDGFGMITKQQGNMIFQMTCNKCHGQDVQKSCEYCEFGSVETTANLNINIPPLVKNNNILRLSGAGNFYNLGMFQQKTDVLCRIHVSPHETLYWDEDKLTSNLNISLLEALTGCEKSIETIDSKQSLTIKPLTKNLDTIIISTVNGVNQHIKILVDYPKNVDKIIEILKE